MGDRRGRNAEWSGVALADVLDAACVQREADDVVFRGADRGNATVPKETIALSGV